MKPNKGNVKVFFLCVFLFFNENQECCETQGEPNEFMRSAWLCCFMHTRAPDRPEGQTSSAQFASEVTVAQWIFASITSKSSKHLHTAGCRRKIEAVLKTEKLRFSSPLAELEPRRRRLPQQPQEADPNRPPVRRPRGGGPQRLQVRCSS